MIIEQLWRALYTSIILKFEEFYGIELSQELIDLADELTDDTIEIYRGQLPSNEELKQKFKDLDKADLQLWLKEEFILREKKDE